MVAEKVRKNFQGNFSCRTVEPIGVREVFEFRALVPNIIILASGHIRKRILLCEAMLSLAALGGKRQLRFFVGVAPARVGACLAPLRGAP